MGFGFSNGLSIFGKRIFSFFVFNFSELSTSNTIHSNNDSSDSTITIITAIDTNTKALNMRAYTIKTVCKPAPPSKLKDSSKSRVLDSASSEPKPSPRSSSNSPSLCSCAPTNHPGSFRCRLHRIQQTKQRKKVPQPSPPPIKRPLLGKSRLSNVVCASSSMFKGTDPSNNKQHNPLRFIQLASAAGIAGAAIKAGVDWVKRHDKSEHDLSISESGDIPSGAVRSGIGKGHVYIVERGDTLIHIANSFGTTVEIMKEANGLKSDIISIGQNLWVPKTYSISKGDTLYKIAKEHGTSVHDLLKINCIDDPNLIFPGDVLLLP